MIVAWSEEAIQDLSSVRVYIAEADPMAAREVVLRILHVVEQLLPNNPHMGRPGRVPGTRELVIPNTPYIVPYRVRGDELQIMRVYHSARRWPDSF
jgi:toxin ParE1/3/4